MNKGEIEELDHVVEDDPNFSRQTKAPRTLSKKRKISGLTTSTRRTPGSFSKKYTTPTHKRLDNLFVCIIADISLEWW